MKIFLSFASEQRIIAEEVWLALEAEGHQVFYDKARLAAGLSYHSDIRKKLKASDAIVFLVSPESTQPGKYTLTELKFAKERWPNPSGKVLPVMLCSFRDVSLDPYLKAVTVLEPAGNIAAEVTAAIAIFSDPNLEQAHSFLCNRDYDSATNCIRASLKEDFSNPRANLYYAIVLLAGRTPRNLDSRTITKIESALERAIGTSDTKALALRLLALIKHEYYVRNSIRQKPPFLEKIIEEIKNHQLKGADESLLSSVTCSSTAFRLLRP
jgi:hypothetical protein